MIFIEIAHSHLCPIDKFGYKVKRDVPLTSSKYFNQQLMNYSQQFASDPEVLAMVKQLGIPTFFMTLSCANLRWNKSVQIIAKLNSTNLTDDDIKNMCYEDRCDTLNKNPVLVARHFQYGVESRRFLKDIVLNGPLGKTKYSGVVHTSIPLFEY